jgi:hypothetical protein
MICQEGLTQKGFFFSPGCTSVPANYGATQTMLAALRLDGLDAPGVVDGAVKGALFHCWVGEVLCPGDMVLWDNLSAHKGAGVDSLIAARGARLLPWSP